MNGLIFNLLETLAQRSGCSDEAWELVAEFATAESVLSGTYAAEDAAGQARQLETERFRAAARTMHQCLNLAEGEGSPVALCGERNSEWRAFDGDELPPWNTDVASLGAGLGHWAFGACERGEWLDWDDEEADDWDEWDPGDAAFAKRH